MLSLFSAVFCLLLAISSGILAVVCAGRTTNKPKMNYEKRIQQRTAAFDDDSVVWRFWFRRDAGDCSGSTPGPNGNLSEIVIMDGGCISNGIQRPVRVPGTHFPLQGKYLASLPSGRASRAGAYYPWGLALSPADHRCSASSREICRCGRGSLLHRDRLGSGPPVCARRRTRGTRAGSSRARGSLTRTGPGGKHD